MKRALFVALAACSSGNGSTTTPDATVTDAAVTSACAGGAAPAISACIAGELFADCGGTGAPVLACSSAERRCSWFTTECVAAGYLASSCPASGVCCQNDWPFAGEQFVEALYGKLYAFGPAPWDRSREMNVGFSVDPTLPQVAAAFRCDGIDPLAGSGLTPCATPGISDGGAANQPRVAALRQGAIVAFRIEVIGPALFGWYPFVEIDTAAGRARVCAYRFTDFAFARCPSPTALCASSGTLALTALPATASDMSTIRGHLDVQLVTLRLIADF